MEAPTEDILTIQLSAVRPKGKSPRETSMVKRMAFAGVLLFGEITPNHRGSSQLPDMD